MIMKFFMMFPMVTWNTIRKDTTESFDMNGTITQLNPPIPLMTPKGRAVAHFIIDYGVENDLMWVCFQDETGECWTWENSKMRARINETIGRTKMSKIDV